MNVISFESVHLVDDKYNILLRGEEGLNLVRRIQCCDLVLSDNIVCPGE